MPKPRSGKQVKSINFDNEVIEALEARCKREKIQLSTFVNGVIRHAVMSDYEYYREKVRQAQIQFAEAKLLMDLAVDNPEPGYRIVKEKI